MTLVVEARKDKRRKYRFDTLRVGESLVVKSGPDPRATMRGVCSAAHTFSKRYGGKFFVRRRDDGDYAVWRAG